MTPIESVFRSAWEVPEALRPSQWAERYRVLSRKQSSRPGPWSHEAAPALAGIMDLAAHPRVRKLNLMKCGQAGVSEATRNIIGYYADREPDPALLNLPNEFFGRQIFADRIIPLFEDTPRLAEQLSEQGRDTTLSQVTTKRGFTIRLGWSGSPTAQAAHPVRIVVNDEVDKFAPWAGVESDPISLAEVRTTTYENSIIINISTPTNRDGLIFRAWDGSPIKLAYHFHCPECGLLQPWVFTQLKWEKLDIPDKKARAQTIRNRGLAWYECTKCKHQIKNDQRAALLMAGSWISEDGSYRRYVDGREDGTLPHDAEIGIHYPCLLSLAAKHSFTGIAAEFIRCEGDAMKTQNFYNSWLGEVFEIRTSRTSVDLIREKVLAAPEPLLIPQWAHTIVATADTQSNHFWFDIRAWGYEFKSQLIHYGIAQTFEELFRVCLKSSFALDGYPGETASASYLLIDTGGNRTSDVYQFCKQDVARIIPCKGASHKMKRPYVLSAQGNGLVLRMFDTGYYKDLLSRLINDPDRTKWMPHNKAGDDFCTQVVAEHKVFDRRKQKEIWTPVTSGAANHLGDCEVLQVLAADMKNLGIVRPPPRTPAGNQSNQQPTISTREWFSRGLS